MKNGVYILITLVSLALCAQPKIKFDLETFDFGEVKEGEIAIKEFTFTNVGNSPLILSSVQPSCGCTTPEWSREPVMPGQKGTIKALFNTNGRPGFFNKSIAVTSNADKPTNTLFIKGSVVRKEEVKYTEAEIKMSPKLVIDKAEYSFGKVEKSAQLVYKLQVKNLGRSDLKMSEVSSACYCVRPVFKEEFIKSGETGTVELVYTPAAFGDNRDVVYIKSNDLTNPSQKFVLTATVVERLTEKPLLKESDANVPFK